MATTPNDLTPLMVVCVQPGTELFDRVFELGEAHKTLVGWLSPQAWNDYASLGRILAAVAPAADGTTGDKTLLGYVAFRVSRERVSLAHLVTHPHHRRSGVARALVDALSDKHRGCRGIQARCRRDYAASEAWPRLGFAAQAEISGRGIAPKPLTIWWRDHGHRDLMSWNGPPPTLTAVVIDANIFIDLHGRHEARDTSTADLLLTTVAGRVQLLVTPELGTELNRHPDGVERERLQRTRQAYPVLSVPAEQMERCRSLLVTHMGRTPRSPRDVSDLTHVAYAAAAGVTVVVTRDHAANRRIRDAAREVFDIDMCNPQELVVLLDEKEGGDSGYVPSALSGTNYTLREAGTADHTSTDAFLDTAAGERRRSYESRCGALAARRGEGATRTLLLDPAGEPVALMGADIDEGVLAVSLLRMLPGPLASTLAAQLVSRLRGMATRAGVAVVHVIDPHPNAVLVEALIADGFASHSTGLIGIAIAERCALARLPEVLERATVTLDDSRKAVLPVLEAAASLSSASSPSDVAAVERQARPLRVLDAPIESWLVPIKPVWSSQLFNTPADLIGQTPQLGISVEHVYYRKGRSGEKAPARVLWYVSRGSSTATGTHGAVVVGCSELVEVRDGTPADLHRSFRRLGVYEWKQVQASADSQGRVRALRVINTEIFDRPVGLGRLRELARQERQTLTLVSPKRISTGLFARIVREGYE